MSSLEKYWTVAFFLAAAMLPFQTQRAIASNPIETQLPDAPQAAVAVPIAGQSAAEESAAGQSAQQPARQQSAASATKRPAPRLAKYVDPDQTTVRLSAREKLELSGWEQIQPYSFGTQVLAAGWEQLVNSDPKYGTDKAGFGERLGAATIRQGSQAILSDGVFAAVFRQDPRYYRKAAGTNVGRAIYSATRVLVTRTDAGDEAANYAQLVGYAGASALTVAYYPDVSATWSKTVLGYGVSLAGSALGNEVHEFAPDLVRFVFHRGK